MNPTDPRLSFDTVKDLYDYLRWTPGRRPSIAAHRGAPPPDFPENALATFEQAMAAAPCWIEIDIRRSKDGAFVLNHDHKLDRSTTGTGLLSDYTFEELRQLRLRDLRGTPTAHVMPTFEEAIEWARDRTILFLDIKAMQADYEAVLNFAREHDALRFSVVLTFEIKDTMTAYRLAPEAMIYGTATNEATARELLESGIPREQLMGWVNDNTPKEIYRLMHDHGMLMVSQAWAGLDKRAAVEGIEVHRPWIEIGSDVINTDDVPRTAAAIQAFA